MKHKLAVGLTWLVILLVGGTNMWIYIFVFPQPGTAAELPAYLVYLVLGGGFGSVLLLVYAVGKLQDLSKVNRNLKRKLEEWKAENQREGKTRLIGFGHDKDVFLSFRQDDPLAAIRLYVGSSSSMRNVRVRGKNGRNYTIGLTTDAGPLNFDANGRWATLNGSRLQVMNPDDYFVEGDHDEVTITRRR